MNLLEFKYGLIPDPPGEGGGHKPPPDPPDGDDK